MYRRRCAARQRGLRDSIGGRRARDALRRAERCVLFTRRACESARMRVGAHASRRACESRLTLTRSETTARRTSASESTRAIVERSASSAVACSARVPPTVEYAKAPGSGSCTLLDSIAAIASGSDSCLSTHDCARLAVSHDAVSSPASRRRLRKTAFSQAITSSSVDVSKSKVLSKSSSSPDGAAATAAAALLQSVSAASRTAGCIRATAHVRESPRSAAEPGSKAPSGNCNWKGGCERDTGELLLRSIGVISAKSTHLRSSCGGHADRERNGAVDEHRHD